MTEPGPSAQPSGAQPKLRITVTDTSTVFTGAANLHRFDAPAEHEIVAYAKNALGPYPDGAVVHLTADPERLARLRSAFADYDVALITEELSPFAFLDEPPPPRGQHDEVPWADGWGGEAEKRRQWLMYALGALVALAVIAVVAVAVWSGRAALGSGDAPAADPPAVDAAADSAAESTAVPAPPTPVAAPETMWLEHGGLRVEVPAGFTIAEDGDTWRATGLDPDFRLHMAVEQLYNLPPQTMAEQVLRDIEADPETELVATDGHSLTYKELPGDGSEVLWKTWPHNDYQIFVACHTKQAPTAVQQATCRMAMDSAVFVPPVSVSGQ